MLGLKYTIEKTNGDPIDPEACYLVLRLDKDLAARVAAVAYAEACPDKVIRGEIMDCVTHLSGSTPVCICKTRPTDKGPIPPCPFHDFDTVVWRHGDFTEELRTEARFCECEAVFECAVDSDVGLCKKCAENQG